MTFGSSLCKPVPAAKAWPWGRRFLRWWRNRDPVERYLGAATDHADVERRIRDLERRNSGSALVTFDR
jgi:hypothetical protein